MLKTKEKNQLRMCSRLILKIVGTKRDNLHLPNLDSLYEDTTVECPPALPQIQVTRNKQLHILTIFVTVYLKTQDFQLLPLKICEWYCHLMHARLSHNTKMINEVATAISTIYKNEMTACGVQLSFQVVRVHKLSLILFITAGWGTNDTERTGT